MERLNETPPRSPNHLSGIGRHSVCGSEDRRSQCAQSKNGEMQMKLDQVIEITLGALLTGIGVYVVLGGVMIFYGVVTGGIK